MSQTTGPVLAMGTITVVNQTIFNGKAMDWRVPIATGLLAVGFTLAERTWPDGARVLAWTGLVAVLFTRVQPAVPSPTESALAWWNRQSGGGTGSTGGGRNTG